ncbi:MAG: aminomethyl-transferring glycine dehydrogenase [Bacteroidetes bacterium]|nr:aminomethyl-transferring glycine dehydrogenase [Bacteroidota bacterium]MBU1578237.1 aminomethyl-transferring glycine dehydrogenase [Bacteroidota bacterium]MBU2556419.1 aminomethyl-transferring glycine dehydrogenase [Bacteroidota bacterium]
MISNNFLQRHLGPNDKDIQKMLRAIGLDTVEQLIDEVIPENIRLTEPLNIGEGINEYEYLQHLKKIAAKNKLFKSYIGMGYYDTITPGVITRNVLENAGWYTAYTPYQAEISQGRLEALLNFQTMVSDLTGLPIANASLLDEATAAAEAMIMFHNARSRAQQKNGVNKFFVDKGVFPQTADVVNTRALPLGIEIVEGDFDADKLDDSYFGVLLQYPDQFGQIKDFQQAAEILKEKNIQLVVAADILSLALLTPPGEWGADAVVGSTQRFGVPMGFGGPHAGYFATHDAYKRTIPGRIIGISKDAKGNPALRMALQTREQHIKRERATSNICTAQALLASMAAFYAIYHGAEGIRKIARHIHILANVLEREMKNIGVKQLNTAYFDTLRFVLPENVTMGKLIQLTHENEQNFRIINEKEFGISLDETTSLDDVNKIVKVLCQLTDQKHTAYVCDPSECEQMSAIPLAFMRRSDYLTHEVFNRYQSETELMRYLKKLENRDLALNRSMIPLGSCTMKLNAAAELFSLSWPEFAQLHPFVPVEQAAGYMELIEILGKDLCNITGFEAMSFQPNSGASGEYTGLLVIRAYLDSIGESQRNVCLIPSSAHGTNPASAVMAGMEVLVVKCDEKGNIDLNDLREKAEKHKEKLAAIMVTYPSTHGVYESGIRQIIDIVHDNGGQVYMDGANMNAQVGLTSPGLIGADVCHLNLHKTFAIPHGGGGPGVGPIGVAAHLSPFLPGHNLIKTGGEKAITAVSAAPFGSAMILPISYGYIKMLGADGLKRSTEIAILSANYLKVKLQDHFPILYTGNNGHVAHEMILDLNQFSKTADLTVTDVAKRLMDYGFHAPTVAFPVHGTLMVEPTESEPLAELDRFVDAMVSIRNEIKSIETAETEKGNNVVSNAPYTAEMLIASAWDYPFSRETAAFPMKSDLADKYFPPVTRIDDAYGDRNLVCTCAPIEDYMD